jgi:signal transduction histidine kinase
MKGPYAELDASAVNHWINRRLEELRLAKNAAEEANRAKINFIAKISHELRTPLSAIIGFAQILLQNKQGNLLPQDMDFIQRILANATDQLQLINTLLDLSKMESGRMDLKLTRVAIDVLAADIAKQMESRKRTANVKLIVDVPTPVQPLYTDEVKLKEVLVNLIDNALKFTERGQVLVRVHTDAVHRRPVRIEIVDTGKGIPQEHLARIFEPFHQVQAQNEQTPTGTGLGLAISKSLCELLGYRLEVQSQVGTGSSFNIVMSVERQTLPLSA